MPRLLGCISAGNPYVQSRLDLGAFPALLTTRGKHAAGQRRLAEQGAHFMRSLTKLTLIAKAAAFIAVIGAAYAMVPSADAAPLGNPLLALPSSSTPAYGFAKPASLASLTGADSDISMNGYWVIDQNGIAAYFAGFQSTPARMVDTGVANATGIALTSMNDFAVSAGSNIYKFRDNGSIFQQTGIIPVTGITSTITDVDYAIGKYFISTQSNGIRRVNADGSSDLIGNILAWSVDEIVFKPNTYDNGLLQSAQSSNAFRNADLYGTPFGSPKPVNLNNGLDIQGVAYYNNGFAVVQGLGVDIHNPLANVQQYMASIPEPQTMALLLGGAVLLGMRNYRRQEKV